MTWQLKRGQMNYTYYESDNEIGEFKMFEVEK